jgi:hypothetical protein
MTTLADLHRAVQTTLASKRLGTPVFVRYLQQGLDPGEAVVPRLARATAAVRDWLGQPLERLYAVGSADRGQVSLTLQFRGGATALVSYARGEPRGAGVDLMVLGNHGALYHDFGSANGWDETAADDAGPDPTLVTWIDRALRSGKPEAAEGKP